MFFFLSKRESANILLILFHSDSVCKKKKKKFFLNFNLAAVDALFILTLFVIISKFVLHILFLKKAFKNEYIVRTVHQNTDLNALDTRGFSL